jgi:drug/metabolite transporter (DMT)-like permease
MSQVNFSKDYLLAILEALFVTVLWSSSWVIIKFGLEEIPPFIFAGLRYSLASIILCAIIFNNKDYYQSIKSQSKQWWIKVLAYGLLFIAITQGAQFLALDLLPAITVSFILNITPFIVIILSTIIISERPTLYDLFFLFITFLGLIMYFLPLDLESATIAGLIVGIIAVLANAGSSILGRDLNKKQDAPPIVITCVSMVIGSVVLLILGISLDSIYIVFSLSMTSIIYIIWLGLINTALAFTIWNKAMIKLRAVDISLINSTMLPQVVLLSIIFLSEFPTFKEWVGLILLVISVFCIQIAQARKNSS